MAPCLAGITTDVHKFSLSVFATIYANKHEFQLLCNIFFASNNRRPSRNKRYIINSWPGLWSSESYEILITSPRGPYIYRAVIFFHLKGRTSCDLPYETDGRLAFNTGHDIHKLNFVIYVYKNTTVCPVLTVEERKKIFTNLKRT